MFHVPENEVESPDDEEDDGEAERHPDGHPEPRGDPVDVAVVLQTCRKGYCDVIGGTGWFLCY